VYTASTKALGLSVEKSRGQENALSLVMKQQLNQQLSTPSREQEFKLLVAAKYLVESQGKLDPQNLQFKSYKAIDGTEIKRDQDSLTITHKGQELKFDRDNATVKNTFTATYLEQQIKARTNQVQQHLQLTRTQTQSRTIGR
jgi:hypothetical protein